MHFNRRHALSFLWTVLVLGLLHASVGKLYSREASGLSPKLRWFEEQKDNFDVVFIGSSRVYHGVSPKIFDPVAAKAGHRWRSFNLGMDGMGMAECFVIIRELVALEPRKLKYVFFELQPGARAGAPKRNDHGAKRERNLDASSSRIEGAVGAPARGGPHQGLGPDGDGFFPMARPQSAEALRKYRQRLQAEKEHPGQRQPNPAVRGDLSRFHQEMAAKNVQVVFIVAPSLRSARGSGINAPSGSVLLSFDDLVRYAPLYKEENRLDAEHLNAPGADVFSRMLAAEFVKTLGSAAR